MPLRVVVPTNDKYLWLIQPFAYLFNKYWSELQPVVVAGFSRPSFHLPPNFTFYQIDRDNYPADRWSDGMIKLLNAIPDTHFVLLLEDYWLCRTVDHEAVAACFDLMRDHREMLRFDLTADRLYAGGMFDVGFYGRLDIIETPADSPYQFSTQAGIWSKERMLELLKVNKTAWETEIQTSVPKEMRVLGTRQYPVRYANIMNAGKFQEKEFNKIDPEHRDFIERQGWIRHG